jgi:CheY-like chemotaxis protein/anti-sigma regulatory factor (Ser/Thr protein kinase)
MKTHILMAEDDRTLSQMLKGLLRAKGYRVTAVGNGQAALKRLREKKYDLLLLDVWMPKMNGFEVLSFLREMPAPPRVIVMTSDGTPESILRAMREQAYNYVLKPFEPEALLNIISDALSAEPTTPPIEVLSARPGWVELLLPCDLRTASRVEKFMANLRVDLPDETLQMIGQAFHELLLNAVEWGGQLDPNRKVRIAFLRSERMLLYRIADPGPGFKFEELSHAAVSNPEDDPIKHMEAREKKGLRPGGLGLFMTKQIVDELLYNEKQNEVVFMKYLR